MKNHKHQVTDESSSNQLEKLINPIDKNKIGNYDRLELFNMLYCLISYNSPYKSENIYHNFLPDGGKFDSVGNYILQVGEDNESETLFCCHMDTVGSSIVATNPVIEDDRYLACSNSKAHCLGGDDKCGFLILNALVKNGTKGTYIYHVGEERGCIGSTHIRDNNTIDFEHYKRAIQFDRRGTTSVITKMMGSTKVCSSDFADALCKQIGLDFKKDDGGTYTDVAKYNELIPEVTNLSCGYTREHGIAEKIDVLWLIDDFIPALYNVDWESLPVVRDPKDKSANTEYRQYHSTYSPKDWESTELDILNFVLGNRRVNQRNGNRRKDNKDYVNRILRRYYDQGAVDIDYDRYENEGNCYSNVNSNANDNNSNDSLLEEYGSKIYESESQFYRCEHCLETANEFENVDVDGKSALLCESCAQIVNFQADNSFTIIEEEVEEVEDKK